MKAAGDIKARLVAQARAEGFVSTRICRPWDVPEVPERLRAFLDAGYHGQMAWMAERVNWRENPAALWPEARSVIMLAESYTPDENPMAVVRSARTAARPLVRTASSAATKDGSMPMP